MSKYMERPSMNPIFMDGLKPLAKKKSLFKRLLGIPRFFIALLVVDLFFWRANRLKNEEGNVLSRLISSLVYRLIFVPVLLLLGVLGLVYVGTHPHRATADSDPQGFGMHFDTVEYTSADGSKIEAWVIPCVSPKRVITQREDILRQKYPAVVLAHDYGQTAADMLPLVRPLHEAGYIVCIPFLRGNARFVGACTFGLREAEDLVAAADMLKKREAVDSRRIGVLGVGMGANAAMLAARKTGFNALIIDRPIKDPQALIIEHLSPPQPWLRNLRPLCKLAFELLYHVDTSELNPTETGKALAGRPMLRFEPGATVASSYKTAGSIQIQTFLNRYLPEIRRQPKSATAEIDTKK